MTRLIHAMAVVALAAAPGASAWAQAPQNPAPKPSAAQPQSPVQPQTPSQPQTQPPPQPVLPPRPEQMPPVPPQVTYRDGQLSIVAQNSTLSSILTAVRARTGARVEMPPDTVNDRVAVQIGPGNPRDVVSSLLEGSRFDYIVLGSVTDPEALSQVILTARAGGAAAPAMAGATPPAYQPAYQPPLQPENPPPGPSLRGGAGRPEMREEDEEEPPTPEPVQPQGEVGQPQPGAPPQPAEGQTNPNQVKTPEQLLQELQRMQQQQQQQQQQGAGQQPAGGGQQRPPQQ